MSGSQSPFFQRAVNTLAIEEGQLSFDLGDKGNWTGGQVGAGRLVGTKFGISAASYPDLDIPHLTWAMAQELYYDDFWLKAGCDAYPWPVAFFMFDFAVNSGVVRAVEDLQIALQLNVDGIAGPSTKAAVKNARMYDVLKVLASERLMTMSESNLWVSEKLGFAHRLVGALISALT